MEFNIEDLLNDLRADICRVYDKNTPAEKQPKQTLDILTVTIIINMSDSFRKSNVKFKTSLICSATLRR